MLTASCWLTSSTAVTTTGEDGGPPPRKTDLAFISASQPPRGIWGPSVFPLPLGALTLGTIFVSGFMITLMRSGLSTKHSQQTTPLGNSRYVGQRPGSGTWPVREEEGELWKER